MYLWYDPRHVRNRLGHVRHGHWHLRYEHRYLRYELRHLWYIGHGYVWDVLRLGRSWYELLAPEANRQRGGRSPGWWTAPSFCHEQAVSWPVSCWWRLAQHYIPI